MINRYPPVDDNWICKCIQFLSDYLVVYHFILGLFLVFLLLLFSFPSCFYGRDRRRSSWRWDRGCRRSLWQRLSLERISLESWTIAGNIIWRGLSNFGFYILFIGFDILISNLYPMTPLDASPTVYEGNSSTLSFPNSAIPKGRNRVFNILTLRRLLKTKTSTLEILLLKPQLKILRLKVCRKDGLLEVLQ